MLSTLPQVNISEDSSNDGPVWITATKVVAGAIMYILGTVFALRLSGGKSNAASLVAFLTVSFIEILYIIKVM